MPSTDNSSWTRVQQDVTLSTTDTTYDSSDRYLIVVNTSNAVWGATHYAMATNGTDAHYSTATYPGDGASFTWSGPAYTDWDFRSSGTVNKPASLNSSLYDQSQNWTNLVTFNSGGWNGNGTAPFDNDAANNDYGSATRSNGGYATLDISSLTGSRVISVTSEQTEITITHDGGTTTYTPTTTNRITHTFAAVNNPTSIKFDGLNSNSVFVLVGVSVDGKRLINSNITPTNVPSIASTTRASAEHGFSIVQYHGSNGVGESIAHNLGKNQILLSSNAQPTRLVGSFTTAL